jgi:hypothetical protein
LQSPGRDYYGLSGGTLADASTSPEGATTRADPATPSATTLLDIQLRPRPLALWGLFLLASIGGSLAVLCWNPGDTLLALRSGRRPKTGL